jgi:hypothetical protein
MRASMPVAGCGVTTEISTLATSDRTRGHRAALSVFLMTAGPGPRVAAQLESLREVAGEILVAVDDRADAATRSDLATVADRLVLYPYADPVDRPLPWLYEQCRGEWTLILDDDELPSLALIEALPSLCADDSVLHYSIQRRWIYPDQRTYLDDSPWFPDYSLRLLRTRSRLIEFTHEFHTPIVASGPGRFVEQPLWHLDPILRPLEQRREKAWRYERTRPGLRVGGRALNFAFYLPELRADLRLAPVPDDEREHIESVLAAESPAGPRRATIEHGSRAEIDRLWPAEGLETRAGGVELLEQPGVLCAGEQRTLDVRVSNEGSARWPWGPEGVPRVRVRSRWYDQLGRELDGEVWTLLPAPLAAGGDQIVPAHVRAPESAGSYRVQIGLLEEHEGPFGRTAECHVSVRARRCLAIVGDDAAVAEVAGLLDKIPELELVRLRRAPAEDRFGYTEAPDARSYLFDDAPSGALGFAVALLWRALRLRLGPTPRRAEPVLAALRASELLVIAGPPDGPPYRRERFADQVLVRTAKALGVPVAASRRPSDLLPLLTRTP